MPAFEYYEPKPGNQWGSVPNSAIYPFEVDEDKRYVYFKDTPPPDSPIKDQKYIVFYYDSPKNGIVRAQNHHPIYVPYILLVNMDFSHAVANFVDLPVFNPVVKKTVTIRAVRRYKNPLKIRSKKKHKHNKRGLKKNKKNKEAENKDKKNSNEEKNSKNKEEGNSPHQGQNNDKGGQGNTGNAEDRWKELLDSKRNSQKGMKKLKSAREHAKNHIDYFLAFEDRAKPNYKIYNNQQAKQIMNGGYDIGIKVSLDYVKPEDINKFNLQNSIMFPPTYTNDADMPAEAMINYLDLQDSLIARILPPYPLEKNAKYTFFYIAPANFKYIDGKKIWIPVYILVPADSKEKPTDMRPFHSYKVKENIGKDSVYTTAEQKAIWTSRKFENMLMNKKFVNIPQKPLEATYFLKPEDFDAFLIQKGLINEGVGYKQKKKEKFASRDPIKIFLKGVVDLLNLKDFSKKAFVKSLSNHNDEKFKKIMRAAKDQRMSLLNDLKRKNAFERNMMKKRVMEMNKKLGNLKKVYQAQKEKMRELAKKKKLEALKKKKEEEEKKKGKKKNEGEEKPENGEKGDKKEEEKQKTGKEPKKEEKKENKETDKKGEKKGDKEKKRTNDKSKENTKDKKKEKEKEKPQEKKSEKLKKKK